MPTYEEALAANPAGFVDYAAEMTSAGTDLTDHQAEYDAVVTTINDDWQDEANTAFNDDVATVDAHVGEVVSQVDQAAELLGTGGGDMASQVDQLKATDAAYRGAGFNVQSEPRVELGAVHWAAIAAAGPFGPVLQALFQARADEGTTQLQLGLAVLTVTDVATGAGLIAAAQQLEPLEDKGGEGKANVMSVEEQERTIDQDDAKGKGENDTGKKTGDDGKDGKDKDGDKDKDEKDDGKDPKQEDEDDPAGPDQQDPQPEGPGTEQPENEIPGMEQPDPIETDVPDFENPESNTPEFPDYDNAWEPGELGDAELPTGGLAGGGGLGSGGGGGGLSGGPADLPSGGTGTPSGGVFATSGTGGAPAGATGSGSRSGAGGFMGAPGARGANVPDDEFERESFLVEDPEEDVWGIGTAEDSPYVDYQGEAAEENGLPPLPPLDEIPPFTLPGFDLPADKR